MNAADENHHDDGVLIRTYNEADQPAVSRLYTEGLLAGQIPTNDTAVDIDMVGEAYFSNHRSHFWVAEHEGQIVGMVGVADDENDVAEIRRLRVDKNFQGQGVADRLMEAAMYHCRFHGYLKVRLDTRLEQGSDATGMFERFAFQHARSREVPGKELLEFYLDLYREPEGEGE